MVGGKVQRHLGAHVVRGLAGLVAGVDENRRVRRLDGVADPAAQELIAFHHAFQPDAPRPRRFATACPPKIAVGLGGAGDMLAGLD